MKAKKKVKVSHTFDSTENLKTYIRDEVHDYLIKNWPEIFSKGNLAAIRAELHDTHQMLDEKESWINRILTEQLMAVEEIRSGMLTVVRRNLIEQKETIRKQVYDHLNSIAKMPKKYDKIAMLWDWVKNLGTKKEDSYE